MSYYSAKKKLVKVNSDKTVSFLKQGRPPEGTTKVYIGGEPLKALENNKVVKVDGRSPSGFRIVA
jgi:hypothetical protein